MIASEGKVILFPLIFFLAISLLMWLLYPLILTKLIVIMFIFLIVFSLYFFREPKRLIGDGEGFLSPADGKIVQIIDIEDSDIGSAKQISIFLSVFNVHSQRVPLSGKVVEKQYNPGKFLAAFNHKASIDNEQAIVLFELDSGEKYKIKQIAGLIARRILNYMTPGKSVRRGDRLGFIRFGSRVDIIVSNKFQINVSLGDIVKGNISIIGYYDEV
jgi:phosphatidylserine decarboxylase